MPKANEPVDPTLPTAEIEIGGQTYKMCLDLDALAYAEAELGKAGKKVELLRSLATYGQLDSALTVFAASLRRFHPEIEFEAARKIPNLPAVFKIRDAIEDLWTRSLPKPEDKPADPPPADQ